MANELSDLLAVPGGPDSSQIADATGNSPIMLAEAALNKSALDVQVGHGGCHYTTGEVILLLGFLLFIIPDIIFLIIFC